MCTQRSLDFYRLFANGYNDWCDLRVLGVDPKVGQYAHVHTYYIRLWEDTDAESYVVGIIESLANGTLTIRKPDSSLMFVRNYRDHKSCIHVYTGQEALTLSKHIGQYVSESYEAKLDAQQELRDMDDSSLDETILEGEELFRFVSANPDKDLYTVFVTPTTSKEPRSWKYFIGKEVTSLRDIEVSLDSEIHRYNYKDYQARKKFWSDKYLLIKGYKYAHPLREDVFSQMLILSGGEAYQHPHLPTLREVLAFSKALNGGVQSTVPGVRLVSGPGIYFG